MAVTITYSEDVKGWTSFKSYIPEIGMTMNNQYYTMKNGELYIHHSENVDRNTFYGAYEQSSVSVLLNQAPSLIKSFKTLGYEGTQSKVDAFDTVAVPGTTGTYGDAQYYNLNEKRGWYTKIIKTDKQEGNINEFIEKEGKWFNYIKGQSTNLTNLDTREFSVQGLGSEWMGWTLDGNGGDPPSPPPPPPPPQPPPPQPPLSLIQIAWTLTEPTTYDGMLQNNGRIDLLVTGGTGNYSYAWSDGSTGASITGLGVGPVAVAVDDGNSQWDNQWFIGSSTSPVLTGTATGTLI